MKPIRYYYKTDSESGTIEANSLQEAYDKIRPTISDEMIEDGATLWVEEPDGSDRITLGEDGD